MSLFFLVSFTEKPSPANMYLSNYEADCNFGSPIPLLPEKGYAELTKELDGGSIRIYTGENLNFHYLQEYNVAASAFNESLLYRVYNFQRKVVLGVMEDGETLISGSPYFLTKYGDNYFQFDFKDTGIGYGNFLLEVVTPKGDKWYLKFKRVEGAPTT